MKDNFSVMGMVDSYAAENDMNPEDIFKKKETPPVQPVAETKTNIEESSISENQAEVAPAPKKKKEWTPDASLTSDMPELNNQGAVYNKDEIKEETHEPLKNIVDDVAKQEALETMDDMSRKHSNIEDCKKRRGYVKLQIPEGPYHMKIFNAASDPDYKKAQKKLDEIFDEIEAAYPEFILERVAPEAPSNETTSLKENIGKIDNVPENVQKPMQTNETPEETSSDDENKVVNFEKPGAAPAEISEGDQVKISIDKTNLPTVAWNEEEIEKIKKSRTIELNIVEEDNIKFGEIEDVEGTAVDRILEQYKRKSNDVTAALPASKYRATFSGLSYPEVLDLTSSQEMNSIDGERKKWSICFDHIHNQSIGAWEEYILYKDPVTKKEVKAGVNDVIPDGAEYHYVSKFEDFLRKTSFLDLDFMLWKILCATSLDSELIAIDCHAIHNGVECKHTYDWLYRPNDLLLMDQINPAVLDEMKQTGEASTSEEIMKLYNSSPVRAMDTVELTQSGWKLVIGHISAYDYLESVYSVIKSLEDSEDSDPTIVSRGMAYATLTVIKAVLIRNDGKWSRIKDPENIVKAISKLDEIDWQTISRITELMINPYQFNYALRDIVCPKCKNRSSIAIEDMSRMLFILARSLSSVQVTLKKA